MKTVGFAATARYITPEELEPLLNFLVKNNIKYKLASNIFRRHYQFAGNDNDRISGFLELLYDTEVDYIWIVRGGYGTSRIVDELRKHLISNPKCIIGYSDITTLLVESVNIGFCSLHGSMAINFPGDDNGFSQHIDSFNFILDYINYGKLSWSFKAKVYNISFPFSFTTKLIGGNLSILSHLVGTKSVENINWEEYSLFIEDVDEYLYSIDRLLVQLKRSGILDRVRAVFIGEFTNIQDNEVSFGMEVEEMVLEKVSVPVISGLLIGHGRVNFPLPLGVELNFVVREDGLASFSL